MHETLPFGNVRNVLARNLRGDVGDDLVALNFYDWQNSSVNFGPGDTVLCENLRLRSGYPAVRLQPAVYRYADGSKVDCALRNILIRNVRGINCFKMYLQTAPYTIGGFCESESDKAIYQYLNYYVFAKVMWDPSVDVGAILDEHHRLMFGKGAAAMTRFFDALEKKWIGEMALPSLIGETEIGPMLYGPKETDIWKRIYSPAFIAELGGMLKEASAAVVPGSLEDRRIAWIKAEIFDRLERRSKAFTDEISVDVERARRAAQKDAKPETRLVSFTGAARLMSLSRSSVYELVRQGRLDAVGLSGTRKITMRSINEFLEGRRPTNEKTAEAVKKSAAKYAQRKNGKED